eukprot:CAMPEP_0119298066 /NCGR_PEP_ID=MMETSP1333-20130426/287_1 /TAXON_ID=418940 /ORGANISM="Scyphosphaera apsteinii, Strain RCC1455" /LENGTH=239 /DNA_ID=CAMNT_0007299073 /DNA_START=152 /DNA_END=871 /DNA_ORIENTATION=+
MQLAVSTCVASAAAGLVALSTWLFRCWWLERNCRSVDVRVANYSAAHSFAGSIKALAVKCFPTEFENGVLDACSDEDACKDVLNTLSGFHSVEDCQWLLAMRQELVLGLAMLVPYHDSLYVASLCVDPAHRRQGLGALLMRSASAHAHQLGLPSLCGTVTNSNSNAKHLVDFYQRLGGSVEKNHAVCSQSTTLLSQRLRAPSGPATAHGVRPPMRITTCASDKEPWKYENLLKLRPHPN